MAWRRDHCSSSVDGMAPRWLFKVAMTFVLALSVSCQKSSTSSSAGAPPGGGTTTDEIDTSGTEVEVSGSVSEDAATEFVQATDSISVAGVNLTTLTTGYSISAFALDSKGQRKLVFSGKFPSRFFYFKSRFPRQYLQIEAIRLTDSGKFGAVLPPPAAPKSVIMRLGRTETIASKKFDLIAAKAASGHAGAIKALSTGSISISDTLAVAQSVRRVLDQKITGTSTPASIDLGSFAQNLIDKSNAKMEALEAEGIANQTLADKISDRTYETVFGPQAEKTPVGVLAHRTNPELGSSAAALTDVAYESIKASTAPGVEAVKVAFKSEAEAYRTAATVELATASEKQVATAYSLSYSQCAAGNSSACVSPTYVPPPPPSYGTPTNIVLGTVATPVPAPPAGVYQVGQALSLSTSTPGAGIYYTLDGSVPTSSSTLYAGPIFVGVSQTVRAIAVRPGYISSNVVTLNYTITGKVQPPVISKGTGSYAGSQIVTLGSSTPGATVYYTLDGSEPSRSSSQYSEPLVISSSQTLKAFAVLNNWEDSSTSIASYTINDYVDSPTFSVPSGGYGPPQSVSIISGTLGATIYYTIDGSTPTTSSLVYSEPIGVSSGMTIKAFATKEFYSDSPVVTAVYSINGSVATPTASLGSGSYTNAQSVDLMSATPGAQIYYTVDGSVPSSSSTPYYGPILVAVSQTIRAMASKAGFSPSGSSSFVYSVTGTVQAPSFSVGSGSYANEQYVSLSSSTPGASIYYTLDGAVPSRSSLKYASPITVAMSRTVKAFAVLSGWEDSSPSSESYVILEKAATPTADIVPGFYSTARSVSLSTATGGASIYYTLDGSVPSTSSALFTTPIFVGVSQTIKAIAVKSGYANSLMGVFSYTITGRVQAPTFSLLQGDYPRAQTVNLSSATPGATIYYTNDGSSPSRSSVRYTMPLYVSSTQTIKAFAVLENWDDSFEGVSSYTINPPVSAPQFSPAGGIYSTSQMVTLSSSTPGAVIYYTTNGAVPTATSSQYMTPIAVSSITTIRAIAVKNGLVDSVISSSVYTISTGSVSVSIDFSSDITTITPSGASATTTSAVSNLATLSTLTGGNPISSLTISGGGTFSIEAAQSIWISSLLVTGPSTVVNINSAVANTPSLSVQNGATVNVNSAASTFDSLSVGTDCCQTSVVTTNSYSGTWSGSAYSVSPSAGNGQLHLIVTNSVNVGNYGVIQMDGKGYKGGQTLGEAGYSVGGPNTFGAGKGGNSGSAGSYASLPSCSVGGLGSGSVYGANDFWTQLYMGSGGGSRSGSAGGAGGGVIKITAGSLVNNGSIRAEGGNSANAGSGGSGGTIHFSIAGSFANNNSISTNGHDCGGYGRVRIDASSLANSNGTIYGIVHSNIVENLTPSITSVTYAPYQLEIVDNGKTYRMGYISTSTSQNYGWENSLSGKSIGTFTISGGVVFDFNAASDISISNLNIRDNGTVVNLNTAFRNSPALSVQSGAVVGVNSAASTFDSLSVGTDCCQTSVVTTNSYSGTWSGSAYS
ncbi:MAG: chitobiase/beta-hexosaminidase C-terminal domain-containing protein, partial [bacterium]